MRSEYVHQKLGEEILAKAGYYTRDREIRLKYNDREILYAVGGCKVDSTCCGGSACFGYAVVPGYLEAWKTKTNNEGLQVSEVSPVSDKETRDKLTAIIQEKEGVRNIEFW